jgi:hypothetical protein
VDLMVAGSSRDRYLAWRNAAESVAILTQKGLVRYRRRYDELSKHLSHI